MNPKIKSGNGTNWKMKTVSIYNEFGRLKSAIIRKPIGSGALHPINRIQARYFASDPPLLPRLLVEHQTWVGVLQDLRVSLDCLGNSQDGSQNPCFTRDVGFAIGNRFFLSNVLENQRKGEMTVLRRWLDARCQPYDVVSSGCVEGGDVLIDGSCVYVGVGQRTNMKGVVWLSTTLGSSWKVIPIQLEEGVLHLDCALAIVSDHAIIWCPDLIVDGRKVLEKRFNDRITVTREEAFHMATNVFMVDPSNVIVEKRHASLCRQLRQRGMNVHSLDWSEMKKFGGLFRCAICPLHRDRTCDDDRRL